MAIRKREPLPQHASLVSAAPEVALVLPWHLPCLTQDFNDSLERINETEDWIARDRSRTLVTRLALLAAAEVSLYVWCHTALQGVVSQTGKGTCDLLAGAVQTLQYCWVYSFITLNKIFQDVSSIFILSEQDNSYTIPVVRRYFIHTYR